MTLSEEITQLQTLTVPQLQSQYIEVFGERTNGHNKAWLVKRIAWRLQANREGTLSERAQKRAEELANDADLRVTIPSSISVSPEVVTRTVTFKLNEDGHDSRLPLPGTVLTRVYQGKTLHVRVLPNRFEWEGQTYPSLSAVAKAITGSHVNGFHFFRLNAKEKS